MMEWPLVFMAGLLGSAHCVGMCGPLALLVGKASASARRNVQRQVTYSAGRIFTYACAGAAAGGASQWLAVQSNWLATAQAWIAVAAGALMAIVGLAATGWLPRWRGGAGIAASCGAASAMKSILTAPSATAVFLAGVATGFIPCGLVYALLLKAAASGTVLNGAATMALFGLGTAPLMIAAGVGGTWVAASTRARLMRAAAWCVVVVGAMTLARGAVQLNAPGDGPAPCPFCASAEDGERQGVSAPSREASP